MALSCAVFLSYGHRLCVGKLDKELDMMHFSWRFARFASRSAPQVGRNFVSELTGQVTSVVTCCRNMWRGDLPKLPASCRQRSFFDARFVADGVEV